MYLEKRQKVMLTKQDFFTCATILMQLGELYIEWTGKASKDAASCFKNALNYSEPNGNALVSRVSSQRLGEIYNELRDFETAITYFRKALPLAEAEQNTLAIGEVKCGLGVAEGSLKYKTMFG